MKAQRQPKTTSASIQSLEAFYEAAKPFIVQYNNWLERQTFGLAIIPDHICYKCSSSQEFESLRKLFEKEGVYLYQSFISGRRIAIIKLPEQIETHHGHIHFLELSDQKPDGSQVSGFDHIEIFQKDSPAGQLASVLAGPNNQAGMRINRRPHHTTYDFTLENGFTIRLEDEPLIDKIKREEMM